MAVCRPRPKQASKGFEHEEKDHAMNTIFWTIALIVILAILVALAASFY